MPRSISPSRSTTPRCRRALSVAVHRRRTFLTSLRYAPTSCVGTHLHDIGASTCFCRVCRGKRVDARAKPEHDEGIEVASCPGVVRSTHSHDMRAIHGSGRKKRPPEDSTCSCYVLLLWCPGRIRSSAVRMLATDPPAKGPARWLPVGAIGIGECAGASQPSCGAFTLFPVYRASQRRREEGLKDVGGLNAEIRTGHPAAAPRPTPYLPGIPGAMVVFQRRRPRMSELGHAMHPLVSFLRKLRPAPRGSSAWPRSSPPPCTSP